MTFRLFGRLSVAAAALLYLTPVDRAAAYDDLTALSDEFDAPETISRWLRIYQTEGWGNNVLEQFDINTSRAGHAVMAPYTSSWYAEWRGELSYKVVTGDFVITTEVEPRNRAGTGAPGSAYSLAGIMVRTPRSMTNAAQWVPGGQNYIFLSFGTADNPGSYQFEVKTTVNSVSSLDLLPTTAGRAAIQIARVGAYLVTLRQESGGAWRVHRRYYRPDMPETLQAGLTVYTDWNVCFEAGEQTHNTHVLTNGLVLPNGTTLTGCNPDLVAAFDYLRYSRPQIPAEFAGADLSDPGAVPDNQLLSFLGAQPNVPGGAATPARFAAITLSNGVFRSWIDVESNRSYRVQMAGNLTNGWTDKTNFLSRGLQEPFLDAANTNQQFYRVVSP